MNSLPKKILYFFYLFFTFFIAYLLILSLFWLKKHFGNISLQSIVFTLSTPLGDASTYLIKSFTKRVFSSALFALASSGILFFLITSHKTNLSRRAKKYYSVLPILVLAVTVCFADARFHFFNYIKTSREYSSFIDIHYLAPQPSEVIFPEKKRNLVILVLESMENSFYDEKITANLIPNLQKIQEKNTFFYNHNQTSGTGWTIGGLTAYFFGLPLSLPMGGNEYDEKFKSFLPNAISLLNILETNKYTINIILGSSANFSGLKNFFVTHSKHAQIYDKNYFMNDKTVSETTKSTWGFTDAFIYEQAKQKMTQQVKEQKTFATILMTIDTHSKAVAYGDYPIQYHDDRDGFVAADLMATEFIHWLQEQPFYENTTLVVLGDHYYMSNTLGDKVFPEDYHRTIYNAFINTGITPTPQSHTRSFTSLDIAPTLLESIGCSLPQRRFGLGFSLFSEEKNLMEQYGLQELNTQLVKRSKLYNSFF